MNVAKVFVDIVVNYVLDLGSKRWIYPYKVALYFRHFPRFVKTVKTQLNFFRTSYIKLEKHLGPGGEILF